MQEEEGEGAREGGGGMDARGLREESAKERGRYRERGGFRAASVSVCTRTPSWSRRNVARRAKYALCVCVRAPPSCDTETALRYFPFSPNKSARGEYVAHETRRGASYDASDVDDVDDVDGTWCVRQFGDSTPFGGVCTRKLDGTIVSSGSPGVPFTSAMAFSWMSAARRRGVGPRKVRRPTTSHSERNLAACRSYE